MDTSPADTLTGDAGHFGLALTEAQPRPPARRTRCSVPVDSFAPLTVASGTCELAPMGREQRPPPGSPWPLSKLGERAGQSRAFQVSVQAPTKNKPHCPTGWKLCRFFYPTWPAGRAAPSWTSHAPRLGAILVETQSWEGDSREPPPALWQEAGAGLAHQTASGSRIPRGSGSRGRNRKAGSPNPGVWSRVPSPPTPLLAGAAASRPSSLPLAHIKAPCEGLGNSCLVM